MPQDIGWPDYGPLTRRELLAFVTLWLLPTAGVGGPAQTAPPALVGIDHIPLVVNDVEQAAEGYRRLGFVIKPGRFHDDGIRNNHVKFADGAGIELITAPSASDELTSRYRALLAQGEGPAFVGLHTADLDVTTKALTRWQPEFAPSTGFLGFNAEAGSLQSFFIFEGNNLSPTDRLEYFAHPNTARATIGIWIAGAEQEELLAFFQALGASVEEKLVYAPQPLRARVAHISNGEIIFLPRTYQLIPGRPIVGAVFETSSTSALRKVLETAGIPYTSPQARSTFVAPKYTHGILLEFRERAG